MPSLTGFGSRRGGVENLGVRHLRRVGASAGVAFVQAMESVCPGAPEVAVSQLLHRRCFQRFLPEHVRKALGEDALRDAALQLPFVAGLVDVFHALEGFRARRQHLALFAPFFPYKVTMELFGVTRWQVLMARLHAAEHGAERPVPPAVTSFRVKPEAAGKLNAFANSPENMQIMACNGGKAHDCIVSLKQVPEKLWQKYEKESADWPADLRVSRTKFLELFNQPGCFQILRAKLCLCGPCHTSTARSTSRPCSRSLPTSHLIWGPRWATPSSCAPSGCTATSRTSTAGAARCSRRWRRSASCTRSAAAPTGAASVSMVSTR